MPTLLSASTDLYAFLLLALYGSIACTSPPCSFILPFFLREAFLFSGAETLTIGLWLKRYPPSLALPPVQRQLEEHLPFRSP